MKEDSNVKVAKQPTAEIPALVREIHAMLDLASSNLSDLEDKLDTVVRKEPLAETTGGEFAVNTVLGSDILMAVNRLASLNSRILELKNTVEL